MKKILNLIAIVVGVLFVGLAIFYWATPANALPSFFPGYDPAMTGVHFKHGVASFILGLALFVWVWFRTGKKQASTPPASN